MYIFFAIVTFILMKKILYLLIPVLLMAIVIFGIFKVFIFQDLGKGALQITSKPFSKVYLDGQYIGTTPLCRCESTNMIRSGEYTLKLIPIEGGFTEFQDKVTVTKGTLTVVDRKFGKGATSEGSIVSLLPLSDSKSSELLVVTIPDNADVYLDAEYKSKAPYHQKSLTDSDHTLRVKKDGYKDKNVRIRTPEGFKLISVIYLGLQDENKSTTVTPVASASGTPTPSISVTPIISGKVTILQTPNGFLRVRQEPSLSSPEVNRVSTGDILDLVDQSTGWYKISLKDGSVGWISADYAKKQ